jgi:hypothetical protein
MEAVAERYKRVNNIRFQGRGKPLGRSHLTERQKAEIVLAKKLQMITQSMIAKEHGVARNTVVNLTEDSLSPEAKSHLASFVENLEAARDKTLKRINEKLDNNDFKDGVYPNLFNVLNTNHRLETNQPTSITQSQDISSIVNDLLAYAQKFTQLSQDQYEKALTQFAQAKSAQTGVVIDVEVIKRDEQVRKLLESKE